MSYQNDLKKIFSYIISSNIIDGSSLELAKVLASKGQRTSRKECLDVLSSYGIGNLNSFRQNSMKLILFYIRIALKDNIISNEEINSVRFLKLLFDINEGDFLTEKDLSNEVSDIIRTQIESMYVNDDKIDIEESIHKVNLQEIFGLNYDQFISLTNDLALDSFERGAEWTDLDSFITAEAYERWCEKNKFDQDTSLN